MLKSRGLIISELEVENSYQPDSGEVVFWKRKLKQILGINITDTQRHHLLKEVAGKKM